MPHVKDTAAHTGESQPVPQTLSHESLLAQIKCITFYFKIKPLTAPKCTCFDSFILISLTCWINYVLRRPVPSTMQSIRHTGHLGCEIAFFTTQIYVTSSKFNTIFLIFFLRGSTDFSFEFKIRTYQRLTPFLIIQQKPICGDPWMKTEDW